MLLPFARRDWQSGGVKNVELDREEEESMMRNERLVSKFP